MVHHTYDRDKNTLRVELSGIQVFPSSWYPISAIFRDHLSGKEIWKSELKPGYWCEWNNGFFVPFDLFLVSAKGDVIWEKKFDVMRDGDVIEKTLWCYIHGKILEGHRPKGLVVGSHDGGFGHWVYPVVQNMSDALLVDGSQEQLDKARDFYGGNQHVSYLHEIVTTDGSDVEWFTGGEGYTDTIVPDVIQKFLKDGEIKKEVRKSVSINELIGDSHYDWIHFDVEGLDGDLIMAMEARPDLIICETGHLSDIKKIHLRGWFDRNGYTSTEHDIDIVAVKKRD